MVISNGDLIVAVYLLILTDQFKHTLDKPDETQAVHTWTYYLFSSNLPDSSFIKRTEKLNLTGSKK